MIPVSYWFLQAFFENSLTSILSQRERREEKATWEQDCEHNPNLFWGLVHLRRMLPSATYRPFMASFHGEPSSFKLRRASRNQILFLN